MGQVVEPGASNGQILASVAPGKWNIAWVRDMAYATVALVRSGHLAEAKAALAFQMGATVGNYQQYVGAPYQISVVRYFGNGTEESDSNADGPNVEFDGFGLFLWSLDEYVKASNDTASLATWWPNVKSKIADVLVKLQEPTGLVSPDSSIWEVHWNGKQRHFAYTTITAANGLCAAARLAAKANDAASNAAYLSAGQKGRDALLPNLRTPAGALVQSTEGLAAGSGFLDAAVVEAINFGLVDPSRRTARASLASLQNGLVPPSGRGFMRSDVGDWYSSQEWVFVDLRASRALALQGNAQASADLFTWNVDQASENFRELSELHDRLTADYAGESPMVGFGAGAYLIALADRGAPVTPTCGAFAREPADPVDAGADAGNPGSDDGGPVTTRPDGGAGSQPDGGDSNGATSDSGSSGGCALHASRGSSVFSVLFAITAIACARRRRR
jgi:GH15 family glucan-1,4-alpha-glucosidase